MKRTNPLVRYGAFMFSVGGARVGGLLITSLTFPYIVRHLGVEMYGLWSYVLAVCAFLDLVANPGLLNYATQQVAARRAAAFDLIPDVFLLRLIGTLVAGILLFVVASLETRPDVRQLFYVYGIGILITNLVSSDYLLTALEMFHARSLVNLVQQSLYALGIFILVRSPKDVVWLPGSILISVFVTNLIGWGVLWARGFRMNWTIQPGRWKGILIPSSHYAASSLMSSLYHRAGHILVRWMLGEHALGLYAAATRLVDILRHFVLIAVDVLMPRMALAATSKDELGRLARFAVVIVAGVSIPLTVGLMSTAHLVVPWFLGARYIEDVPLLRWMALYIITASAASLLSGTILYAMGRHRAYLASTGGGALAGVLLYLVLIPTMGLAGAGLAYILAEFVVALIAYVLLPRELRDLWRSPMVGYISLASIAMGIAIRVVNAYVSEAPIVISVGAFVYLILCYWFSRKWLIAQLTDSS